VLGRPDLLTDPRFSNNDNRVKNREALDAEIVPVFLGMTREQAIEVLSAARLAYGRVSSLDDLAVHPQNRYLDVETPSGPVRLLAPGVKVDGETLTAGRVPAAGEHGEALRGEFTPKATNAGS
jgi:crotonobetainyl-CoA:carnitine CoA-transferase CaiB-like acyl-CoA transferase